MLTIDKSTKQEFENYCKEKYSGRKIASNITSKERWFYLEAGHDFQEWIHYEYYAGKVHLHLEKFDNSKLVDISDLNDFIKETNKSDKVYPEPWDKAFQWTLKRKKEIETLEELFADFDEIISILEPIINQYEILHDIKNGVAASVKNVDSLLSLNLIIPEFQRPYEWTTKNVQQLLNDVNTSLKEGKDSYRIGSIILFYNKDKCRFEIVDGQQRLTTILSILKACEYKNDLSVFNKLQYSHSESFKNIQQNYKFLMGWRKQHPESKQFVEYLLNKCEFVQIVVTNLSEAFQMFDSQNGRGKPLEAYNLLKAYHLRAMESNTQEEKINADKRWENAVRYKNSYDKESKEVQDLLKSLFGEQLYRSRMWSKYLSAGRFSKTKIDEFKGYTIDKNTSISFPYQNPQLLQYITSKFYQSVLSGTISMKGRLISGDPSNIDPFANVNQDILNGKPFFDYIETYVEIYKMLFIDMKGYQLRKFKDFYSTYCINYEGSNRKGDKYLLELYKSLIFVLFDKFGEEVLNDFYKNIYALVYKKRLIHKQIKYETVDNHKEEELSFPHDYFFCIQNAKNVSDLQFLRENNSIKKADIHFREIDDDEGKKSFSECDVFYTFFDKEGLITNESTK